MSAEEQHPPIRASRVFEALDRHGVDYLIVGGFAVQFHGHERTTRDLDLLVNRTRENLGRLAAALGELGAELQGVDPTLPRVDVVDRTTLDRLGSVRVRSDAGDLDIFIGLDQLAGATDWDGLWERSVVTSVGSARVHIVGRDDLIGLKRAASKLASRPAAKAKVDRRDVDVLTARAEDLERAAREMADPERPPKAGAD